ncbi:MAG: hypothetical protein ACI4J3_00665 [Oscillospiraceae bacterium]
MKKLTKPFVAFVPAMLLMLFGMRLFGLITVRNTASDFENFRQILQSPEPDLADFAEIYQYQYNAFNLFALLTALTVILSICIGIRNGTLKRNMGALKKLLCGIRLPNISAIYSRISSFLKGIQYGQISDVKRSYRVVMRVCDEQQSFLFAADKSEKPSVMDLSCFDVVGASGEGLVRIFLPKTVLLWNRKGVSLITKGKPFSVIGEDRTTTRVHISAGEQVSVTVNGIIITMAVS